MQILNLSGIFLQIELINSKLLFYFNNPNKNVIGNLHS
jgi:hypothetical protein